MNSCVTVVVIVVVVVVVPFFIARVHYFSFLLSIFLSFFSLTPPQCNDSCARELLDLFSSAWMSI